MPPHSRPGRLNLCSEPEVMPVYRVRTRGGTTISLNFAIIAMRRRRYLTHVRFRGLEFPWLMSEMGA